MRRRRNTPVPLSPEDPRIRAVASELKCHRLAVFGALHALLWHRDAGELTDVRDPAEIGRIVGWPSRKREDLVLALARAGLAEAEERQYAFPMAEAERRCAWCGTTLAGSRADKRSCGSTCRNRRARWAKRQTAKEDSDGEKRNARTP